MKRALLLLLIIILIFPTAVSAYEINKSYKKANEDLLNGVDCIGVDAQENVYLKNFFLRPFKSTQIKGNSYIALKFQLQVHTTLELIIIFG